MVTPKQILLINPTNRFFRGNILPPLGLLTNASYIPKNYKIRIIDENCEEINYNADLIALTANSITIRRAYEICTECKKRNIPVIIGGIHVSMMPEEAEKYATSVIIGEGESVWKDILNDFEGGKLKKRYNAQIFDLEKSRIPRRDLAHKYFFGSIETARGCPFGCEFCSVTQLYGRTYRYKPLETIRKELDTIKNKNLFIVDDNFLGAGGKAKKRCIQLLKLLKEYKFDWFGQTSVNIADHPDILKLAKESGAISFFIGFESLNVDFLKSTKKYQNLEKCKNSYKQAIKKIHKYGIGVMASFIYGTDFDTKRTIQDLIKFSKEAYIDSLHTVPLTPLPGTKVYDTFKEQNRLFNNKFWLENPYPIFTFKPKKLSIKELIDISAQLNNELRPSKSVIRFIKSYLATRNIKAALINFFRNIGEYYNQKQNGIKIVQNYFKNNKD